MPGSPISYKEVIGSAVRPIGCAQLAHQPDSCEMTTSAAPRGTQRRARGAAGGLRRRVKRARVRRWTRSNETACRNVRQRAAAAGVLPASIAEVTPGGRCRRLRVVNWGSELIPTKLGLKGLSLLVAPDPVAAGRQGHNMPMITGRAGLAEILACRRVTRVAGCWRGGVAGFT